MGIIPATGRHCGIAPACRFPGSRRSYVLVPKSRQATLTAYPERFAGQRLAFVTDLLFPEYHPRRRRLELRLFEEMSSPPGLSLKSDELFPRLVENNPENGDMVIIHARMMTAGNPPQLFGQIEEILFLDPARPDGLVPLGVRIDYDDGPGSLPDAADTPATPATSPAPVGLARAGYRRTECLLCFAKRSPAAVEQHSDARGFGLCERCGEGAGLVRQARRLQERQIAVPPELLRRSQEFGQYAAKFVNRDDTAARRGLVLLILTEFQTPDWNQVTSGEQ